MENGYGTGVDVKVEVIEEAFDSDVIVVGRDRFLVFVLEVPEVRAYGKSRQFKMVFIKGRVLFTGTVKTTNIFVSVKGGARE